MFVVLMKCVFTDRDRIICQDLYLHHLGSFYSQRAAAHIPLRSVLPSGNQSANAYTLSATDTHSARNKVQMLITMSDCTYLEHCIVMN
jgi:hypothetical protein